MNVQQKLRYWIRHLGYDIQHFSHVQHSVARRAHLVKNENIELVLDIGANHGQYAMGLRRELGYRGDIISFEPLNSAFEQLKKHAQGDQR